MNIIFTIDISLFTNFLKEYNEYKAHFEANHLKKIDNEYRCRKWPRNDLLMNMMDIEAYNIIGRSHDCGNKLGYVETFIEYALRNKEIGADLKKSLAKYFNK